MKLEHRARVFLQEYTTANLVSAKPGQNLIECWNTAVGDSFNHLSWRRSCAHRACWRPLLIIGVVRAEFWVLSLSLSLSLSLLVEEGICLPLEVRQESWPNFKGITKGK